MKRLHVMGLAILSVAAAALAQQSAGQDHDKLFESLFGDQVRAAAATPDSRDDAALSARLMDAAVQLKDDPEFQAYMLEKVYELGIRNSAGYSTAMDAMKLLSASLPERAQQCREKMLRVYQLQYSTAAGLEKVRAGEALIEQLLVSGDAAFDSEDWAQAESFYRQASNIASFIRSPRTEDVAVKIKLASARVETDKKVKELQGRLKADPGDAVAATQLVMLCVVELDDPARAAGLIGSVKDEKLRINVPLAALKVDELAEGTCLDLADWYRELAYSAAAPLSRAVMLARARTYYEQYLQVHAKQDAMYLKAKLAVDEIAKQLASLPAPEMNKTEATADKIVIWNSHGKLGDRGTSAVNVSLLNGTEVVWREQNITIPWQSNADAFREVFLPRRKFTAVRIEITRWQGLGGALAEVQVLKDGRNIAKGCSVAASGTYGRWASNGPDRAVDGATGGSAGWLLQPTRSAGWIQIDLTKRAAPPAAPATPPATQPAAPAPPAAPAAAPATAPAGGASMGKAKKRLQP